MFRNLCFRSSSALDATSLADAAGETDLNFRGGDCCAASVDMIDVTEARLEGAAEGDDELLMVAGELLEWTDVVLGFFEADLAGEGSLLS